MSCLKAQLQFNAKDIRSYVSKHDSNKDKKKN